MGHYLCSPFADLRRDHYIHGQHRMENLLKVPAGEWGVVRDEFVELIGKALVAGRERGRITLFVCHLLAEAHKGTSDNPSHCAKTNKVVGGVAEMGSGQGKGLGRGMGGSSTEDARAV